MILRDFRRVGDPLWARFTANTDQTLWYYNALVEAFRAAGTNPLVEQLATVVEELTLATGRSDPLHCPSCGKRTAAQWAPYCVRACSVSRSRWQNTPRESP